MYPAEPVFFNRKKINSKSPQMSKKFDMCCKLHKSQIITHCPPTKNG